MRYNKVTSYLGQVGNKRNITTNGHSIRKEFWPSPLLFGGYSGTRRFPWCSPSLDGPNKAYSWMTSVNSEYIFRQVQLVPETCIPIIYPLYTWYIPIVYPSYTQAHQFRIEWAWNSLLVHQLHGIGCSGPSTETSFRIHKGIGIEVESSFHLQLWSFIKFFNLTNFYGHTQMVFQEILPWVYGVPAPSPVKRPYFSSARWHIGTSWLNALQWWPN